MSVDITSSLNQGGVAPRILLHYRNYYTWSTLVESELDNIECWDAIDRDPAKRTPEKERKSYHLIIRYLSEEILGFLSSVLKPEDRGRGSVALRILKEKFAGETTYAKSVAYNTLHRLRFKDSQQYINDACRAIAQFRASGLKMESECISLLLLKGLPSSYNSLIRVISQMDPIPDKEDTIRRIEKDEIQFK